MSYAPLYPSPTWECAICGATNPGDLGFCTGCRGQSIQPFGGLFAGERPYFPAWHFRQAGYFEELETYDHQEDEPVSEYKPWQ